MISPLDTDTKYEVTKLRSEIRLTELRLQNRIKDVELRLADWRLNLIAVVSTVGTIIILGTLIILR